jgi:UDP-galactopyranose mutase
MPEYDFLIVGAGLFGSVFAYQANLKGKKVIVIDQRKHIGGNCYTENKDGIEIHRYGAHIFHTSNQEVWDFITQFGEFNHYINQPISMVDGVPYNLPFNMNMFSKVFGITRPEEAQRIIESERKEFKGEPENLEEQAISLVGKTIYSMFIKGYTEKQWGRKATELPASYIKRLPVRFTYDNNYFNDIYQGIPKKGYTYLIKGLLKGIRVVLNTSFNDVKEHVRAKKIIYTGMIDEYFDYNFGSPEYRSLKFIDVKKETQNYQGVAVVNYPTHDVPYTRSIEHKHFDLDNDTSNTIVTYEFPTNYYRGGSKIPYYPVGNSRNQAIYDKYLKLTKEVPNTVFAGRLGSYQYYDMDDTIENALNLSKRLVV